MRKTSILSFLCILILGLFTLSPVQPEIDDQIHDPPAIELTQSDYSILPASFIQTDYQKPVFASIDFLKPASDSDLEIESESISGELIKDFNQLKHTNQDKDTVTGRVALNYRIIDNGHSLILDPEPDR